MHVCYRVHGNVFNVLNFQLCYKLRYFSLFLFRQSLDASFLFPRCLKFVCADCDLDQLVGTIFDCPVSQLYMEEQSISFAQWTPMDLTEMEFEDPLQLPADLIFNGKLIFPFFFYVFFSPNDLQVF